MTQALQKLIPQLDQLSPQERARLASYLIRSLDGEVVESGDTAEFDRELQRRLADLESGADPGQSIDEVLRELREET